MSAMEQLWLILSLAGLITGFGLVVALMFLKRIAPLKLPPVVTSVIALLVMGLSSFFGVYLRVIGMPRSLPAYRLPNAAALGYAAFALVLYLMQDRRLRRPGGGRDGTAAGTGGIARRNDRAGREGSPGRDRGTMPRFPAPDVVPSVIGGFATFVAACDIGRTSCPFAESCDCSQTLAGLLARLRHRERGPHRRNRERVPALGDRQIAEDLHLPADGRYAPALGLPQV